MSDNLSTPAAPCAPARGVSAWLRLVLVMWCLSWLPLPAGLRRLLAREDELPPGVLAAFADDASYLAAAVVLGLLPGWVLGGVRNRGMRSKPRLHVCPRRRGARAPPPARTASRQFAEPPLAMPFHALVGSAPRWPFMLRDRFIAIRNRKGPGVSPGARPFATIPWDQSLFWRTPISCSSSMNRLMKFSSRLRLSNTLRLAASSGP